MLVVVPVARCRAAALMRRRNVAGNVNRRERGTVGRRIFVGKIGFLVKKVMSVPRRNIMLRRDCQEGRYVNQSSILCKDTDGYEKLS